MKTQLERIDNKKLIEILQGHSFQDMIVYPEPVEGSKNYIISITWTNNPERSQYLLDPGFFQLKN